MPGKGHFSYTYTLPHIYRNMRDERKIIAQLNKISSQSNFLKVLLYLVGENLNCSTDELTTRDFRALLNENEITFLFGFG